MVVGRELGVVGLRIRGPVVIACSGEYLVGHVSVVG